MNSIKLLYIWDYIFYFFIVFPIIEESQNPSLGWCISLTKINQQLVLAIFENIGPTCPPRKWVWSTPSIHCSWECISIYIYIPGTQTTIFEGKPLQNKALSNKNTDHLASTVGIYTLKWFCWWKESCTSWDGAYPIFHRVLINNRWCRISTINSLTSGLWNTWIHMSTSKKKWNTIVSLQLPSLCDRSALPTLILFKWLTSEWLVCFFGWAPNHNKKSSFVARSWFMLLRLGCFRFLGNKHPHFLVDGWICCVLCLFSSLFVYRGETSQALLFVHQSWNYVNCGGLLSFLFIMIMT